MQTRDIVIENIFQPPLGLPDGGAGSAPEGTTAVLMPDGTGSSCSVKIPDDFPTIGSSAHFAVVRQKRDESGNLLGELHLYEGIRFIACGNSSMLPGPREMIVGSTMSPSEFVSNFTGCLIRVWLPE